MIVFVLALFSGTIFESGHPIAMATIIQPFTFIFEAVGSFTYSSTLNVQVNII